MRRLVFGGSFNPIHNGHLLCSRAVAEKGGFDRITLIPSAQPPHKPSATMAASTDRLAMCRLAVAGDPFFEVDDLELRREGNSYSFDTARELKARGDGPIHWLIGADMLLYLPKWHRAVEILTVLTFVVIARPGWSLDWDTLPSEFRHLRENVVQAPLIELSASEIRARAAAGLSLRYMTPGAVCDYIEQRKVYL
jgi:nicotinate-nucleotide adenylyltransferase